MLNLILHQPKKTATQKVAELKNACLLFALLFIHVGFVHYEVFHKFGGVITRYVVWMVH